MLRTTLPALIAMLAHLLTTGSASPAGPSVHPSKLRCEYRTNPLGIGETRPRLSWVLETGDSYRRGQTLNQTAYQVLVASTPDLLRQDQGDLWDSGKIKSDATNQVVYDGKPLDPGQRCWWKVRVDDQDGRTSAWSDASEWSIGLLTPGDWRAKWVGYDAALETGGRPADETKLFAPNDLAWLRLPEQQKHAAGAALQLRRAFDLPTDRAVKRATIVLAADDTAVVSINGRAAGQTVKWEPAQMLDLTPLVKPGANVAAIAVTQDDGYPPMARGRIVVEFDAGDPKTIALDTSCKASPVAPDGWTNPDFDDSGWASAQAAKSSTASNGMLADHLLPPAPYLRKTFTVGQPVKRATVYATALGLYELHLNGGRASRAVLTPGWTDYRERVYYETFDVTGQVKQGENAIGAVLGDGWYAGYVGYTHRRKLYGGKPRLLVQLDLELADGSHQLVVTDDSWKASYGPIRYADLLAGCGYDARLEMPGWDAAGFDDGAWQSVAVGRGDGDGDGDGEKPLVQANPGDPVRVFEELPARGVSEPRPGRYIFDLGQNMVGWARLRVRGKPGQKVTVRHGEMLNPDGTLYTTNLRSAMAADVYYLKGTGEAETLEPAFTFHGFRYVELRGLDERPDVDAVTGVVVHTDMERTGSFECSDPRLNQLFHNIIWGQKGNYVDIPTDCPQRDERLGWTGDTQFFVKTGAYNFDVAPFFTRWLVTLVEDSQAKDGSFAHVAPAIANKEGAVAWGDAALICTYRVWQTYGDTRIIERHYAAMQRYFDWPAGRAHDYIVKDTGFGDWLNMGGSASKEVTGTAYYAYLTGIMAEMADAIGRHDDAAHYRDLHGKIRDAFIRAFVEKDGRIKESSQTGFALAFTMGLLPDDVKAAAAAQFVGDIEKKDWHLATGFIGTPRLLPALHLAGRDDVAYRLLLQDTFPSWLYQVKNGATTMWERWDGWTADKGFQTPDMNSFNHYAFGAVGEYLYGTVAGLDTDGPGYRRIFVRPVPGGGLTYAKATFESINGTIATGWHVEGGTFTLDVTIPPNVTATITVPSKTGTAVTEQGDPVEKSPGISDVVATDDAIVCKVGSGRYRFVSTLP